MKSSNAAESAATEELLKKIQELEVGQVRLQQEMSQLMTSPAAAAAQIVASDHRQRQRPHSISPQRVPRPRVEDGVVARASLRHLSPLRRQSRHWRPPPPSAVNFTDKQYLNILQSMGQSIHIMDPNNLLIYWLVYVGIVLKLSCIDKLRNVKNLEMIGMC